MGLRVFGRLPMSLLRVDRKKKKFLRSRFRTPLKDSVHLRSLAAHFPQIVHSEAWHRPQPHRRSAGLGRGPANFAPATLQSIPKPRGFRCGRRRTGSTRIGNRMDSPEPLAPTTQTICVPPGNSIRSAGPLRRRPSPDRSGRSPQQRSPATLWRWCRVDDWQHSSAVVS
jgi:hypothetical protein